ncbi:MAG: hypothetical protein ACRYFX_04560 [Janthinobacterium lividum]
MIAEQEQDELLKLHYNKPQLLVHLIMAQVIVCVWGRRTGKTEGPMADFTLRNVHAMPRSNGFLVGTTYEQLLTRTLPPLVAAWAKQGYYQDVHYWIRKFPPAQLKVPKAYRTPLKADHYIQWYNGSGIYLVSQDRPGTINGVSTQWGAGDEAKFLNVNKLREETLLTLSGCAEHFAHLSCYLSLMFCSDMPTTSRGTWLLDYEAQMDKEAVQAILLVQQLRHQLLGELEDTTLSPKKRAKHEARVAELDEYLTELRKDLVYYSEATTLDNIHALGLAPIKQFKRTLNEVVFNSSVLNKKVLKVENGFYSLLSEDSHAYDATNYDYLDRLHIDYTNPAEADSRWDSDVNPLEPLDVALDYNNAINSLVVGQERGQAYNCVNSLFVLGSDGLLLRDVVKKFCAYYKYHQNKVVNYFYDHTAVARSPTTNMSFADEVMQEFRAQSWIVVERYIGQSSSHHSRYYFWGMLFKGDSRLPRWGYNRTRFAQAAASMQQAPVKRIGEFFKKDKASERSNSGVPPEQATHLSEATDTLLWGRLRSRIGNSGGDAFVDTAWG